MLIINTNTDIKKIKQKSLLHNALIQELEQYFKEITESLTGDAKAWKTYNIEEDGSIIVLQPEIDDPSNIEEFGFSKENGGLFEAPIEFVILISLEEIEFYKTTIVINNSCCIVIFSEKGKFQEDFDQFLEEYILE